MRRQPALLITLLLLTHACGLSPASRLQTTPTSAIVTEASIAPPSPFPNEGEGENTPTAELQTIETGAAAILLTYSPENRAWFDTIATPSDRMSFFRQLVQSGEWPQIAQGLPPQAVMVTWPSWKDARLYEAVWAPYVGVFGYDIEADSPSDEIADVASTIHELRAYLSDVSSRYGHAIELSCGLNYRFGTRHAQKLALCDSLHIHALHLLRIYPQEDPNGDNFVEWAIARAVQVSQINPSVALWFSVLAPDTTVENAQAVAAALAMEMSARGLVYAGFTLWTEDLAQAQAFLEWLR